ncbi:melanoma-associated antigen C1-like [Ranitomeya imitator]|uniref:melanoma-associated antigen C1-like n=1 Tax=Ranitomeya imitator TaxID=111125 RepID=UPI0037E87841
MSPGRPPPPRRPRTEEADEAESPGEEVVPEDEGRGGETHGEGSQLSSESGAQAIGPSSGSRGRRRHSRGGRRHVSQRAPDSDGEEVGLDIDLLIDLVRDREPLWNMGDRRHADLSVTRRLWEQICCELIPRWEDLDVQAQIQERERIVKRWRSIRDRFKKEFNKEMQARSGSGGRRSTYKYARALSFLRSTMVTRSTVGSTLEPAAQLNTSGAIPQEAATEGHFDSEEPSAPSHSAPSHSAPSHSAFSHSAPFHSAPSHSTDPSFPSTSTGASWPVPLHVAAGENIAFPVPHPSAAATSSTPVASGRFRQRGQIHSYAPEFLHLNASFQNCLKVLSEQMAAGFNFINKSMLEMHTLLVTMRSEAKQSPNNTFFQSVLEQMETLSTSQQMQVMESCQSTLALIASRADSSSNHPPTCPPSSTVHHYSQYHPPDPYRQTDIAPSRPTRHHPHRAPSHQPHHQPRAPSHHPHYQHPSRATSHPYDDPDPYNFPSTSSSPPLPAHFQQTVSPSSQTSSTHITHSATQSSQNISYTPPPYQISNPNPTFLSTRSIAFSTPSPLTGEHSPPPSHSSLHTPTVEVSLSDSASDSISTPTYENI